MTELKTITPELMKSFDLADIDLLPKSPKVDKQGRSVCMGLPYADIRVYQDRLNALCPGEWSTPLPTSMIVGNKLVMCVSVIVCGVVHSDVGEAPSSSENAATEALAQGFKRACSQFGLGRYLYDLEKEYVPYNKEFKRIDLDKEQKRKIVEKMYKKAGIPVVSSAPTETRSAPQQNEERTTRATTSAPPVAANPPTQTELRKEYDTFHVANKKTGESITWEQFLQVKFNLSDEKLQAFLNSEWSIEDCQRVDKAFTPYRQMLLQQAS